MLRQQASRPPCRQRRHLVPSVVFLPGIAFLPGSSGQTDIRAPQPQVTEKGAVCARRRARRSRFRVTLLFWSHFANTHDPGIGAELLVIAVALFCVDVEALEQS